jgi:hypothetical protein
LLSPSVHYVTEEPHFRNATAEISAQPHRPRFNAECPGRSRTSCCTTSRCRSRIGGATGKTECSSVAAIRTTLNWTTAGSPDHTIFNDMQPRIVCSIWDHRGADVSPSWLHHSQREFGGESHRVERTTKFMLAAVIGTTAPNLIGIVLLGFFSPSMSANFSIVASCSTSSNAVLVVRNNCH